MLRHVVFSLLTFVFCAWFLGLALFGLFCLIKGLGKIYLDWRKNTRKEKRDEIYILAFPGEEAE